MVLKFKVISVGLVSIFLCCCSKYQSENTSPGLNYISGDSSVSPPREYYKELEDDLRHEHKVQDDDMDYYIQFLIDEGAISQPTLVYTNDGNIFYEILSYKDYLLYLPKIGDSTSFKIRVPLMKTEDLDSTELDILLPKKDD